MGFHYPHTQGRNTGGTGVARCGELPSRLLVYLF